VSMQARRVVRLEGVSILELSSHDETAREWLIQACWPDGVCYSDCISNRVSSHRQMRYRCRQRKGSFPSRKVLLCNPPKLGYASRPGCFGCLFGEYGNRPFLGAIIVF